MSNLSLKTCADIAAEEGVSICTIRRWAKAAGYKLGWGGGRQSLSTLVQVAGIVSPRKHRA